MFFKGKLVLESYTVYEMLFPHQREKYLVTDGTYYAPRSTIEEGIAALKKFSGPSKKEVDVKRVPH